MQKYISKKHILITGMQRSGTTFTAKILNKTSKFTYLPEPFNPNYGIQGVDSHYTSIDNKLLDDKNKLLLKDLFTFKARYKKNYKKDYIIKKTAKYIFGTKAEIRYRLNGFFNKNQCQFLIKDPDAILLSEYMAKTHNCKVLSVIRHPCAVLASFRRLGWEIDFSPILSNIDILNSQQSKYIPMMQNQEITLAEQVGILWLILYQLLIEYHSRNNDWLMIRHEDICKRPDESFNKIFNWAKLKYSQEIKNQVQLFTSSSNPIQARNNMLHDFNRNAISLASNWKDEIAPNHIETILKITNPVLSLYYDDHSFS